MVRMDAYWSKLSALSIASGYLSLGESERADRVLLFISDHVVTDSEICSFCGLYDRVSIAQLYVDCGRVKEADLLIQAGEDQVFGSRVTNGEAPVLTRMIRWYADQGRETEARQLVERSTQAIPLSESFDRWRFVVELIDHDLDRFVPEVLAPMVEYSRKENYSAAKYRLHAFMSIAKMYRDAGFVQEAHGLLGEIESIVATVEDEKKVIPALGELAELYLAADDKTNALRILEQERVLIDALSSHDFFKAHYVWMGRSYVTAGEFSLAKQVLSKAMACIDEIEMSDYNKTDCLAHAFVEYQRMNMPDEAEKALSACYKLALGMEGHENQLVAIALLKRSPFDPTALSYWGLGTVFKH
jgi:tetratricopeptide (TPR) repeat protein